MATVNQKVDYPVVGKAAKVEAPDPWVEGLREDTRNPIKIILFLVVLIVFTAWALSFIAH